MLAIDRIKTKGKRRGERETELSVTRLSSHCFVHQQQKVDVKMKNAGLKMSSVYVFNWDTVRPNTALPQAECTVCIFHQFKILFSTKLNVLCIIQYNYLQILFHNTYSYWYMCFATYNCWRLSICHGRVHARSK